MGVGQAARPAWLQEAGHGLQRWGVGSALGAAPHTLSLPHPLPITSSCNQTGVPSQDLPKCLRAPQQSAAPRQPGWKHPPPPPLP